MFDLPSDRASPFHDSLNNDCCDETLTITLPEPADN